MGYGGVINKVVDPFGIGNSDTTPDVPNVNNVTRDYLGLVKGFTAGAPLVFNAQKEFLPKYTDLGLENLSRTLSGPNGLTADILGTTEALRGVDRSTGLADSLRSQAATGLAEGSQWNPEDLARTTAGVRSSWANRGLGTSMPAQLDETLAVLGGGENLRQQRQGFAQSVVGMDQADAARLIGEAGNVVGAGQGISTGAGPTLFPTNQTYDAFNTAYNARAAANIAGANNKAAAENSY